MRKQVAMKMMMVIYQMREKIRNFAHLLPPPVKEPVADRDDDVGMKEKDVN